MALNYETTNWENGKTVLRAEHLRKIEKGITDIIAENDAIYKDEDTRKSNEKQRQEEHSRKMNEVSGVVNDIQKDYDSLQKIIIDENASANLQNQINSVNSQLEHKTKEINTKIDEIYITTLSDLKNAVLKSNTIINLKPQEYILDSLLDISSVENITINGNGSVIKTGNYFYIRISNDSKNININNLIFDGELVTNSSNNHHLWLRDCENILISNCEFKNLKYGTREGELKEQINGNDGIYLRSMTHDSPKYANKNITIRDCKFSYISRNGISIVQGENILIDNCYFASRRAGVDIEPNNVNELTKNVIVQNCYADGTLNYVCYNSDGTNDGETIQHYAFELSGNKHSSLFPDFGITQITFKNNKVIGHNTKQLTKGIKMSWVDFGSIENNTLVNCTNNLSEFIDNGVISLYRFNTGYILNNIIENYGLSKGIRTYTGNELVCSGNIVKNGDGYGLHIGTIDIDKSKISNCIFENCGNITNSTIYGSYLNFDKCSFISSKEINDFIFLDNNNKRDSICNIENSVFDGGKVVNYGVRTISGSVKTVNIINSEFKNITGNITQLASRDTQTNRVYKFINNTVINSAKVKLGAYVDSCTVLNNTVINCGDGSYVFDFDKVGGLIFSNNNISLENGCEYALQLSLGDMTRIPKIISGNIFKGCVNMAYALNDKDIEVNNVKI